MDTQVTQVDLEVIDTPDGQKYVFRHSCSALPDFDQETACELPETYFSEHDFVECTSCGIVGVEPLALKGADA